MLEFMFEIIGEFLLQVIGQALVELGFHAALEPFSKPPNPFLAAIGYFIFGAIAGWLSLFLFPAYLVPSHALRIINLVVTPIGVGGCLSAMGAWRARRGQTVMRIDKFAYAYLFALSVALVRFYGGE
jgi:hypothetical protein